MSCYHIEKCTKEEAQSLKTKVLAMLKDNGIDTDKLDIKALTSFNGDVRVYLKENIRTSQKTAFRRERAEIKDGEIVGYHGTRGKHQIKERDYVVFNSEDFEIEDKHMVEYNILEIKKYLNNGTN